MMKHAFLLSTVLLLVGCARTTPMVLGPGHPASPDSAVAPVPPPSQTLAVLARPTTAPSNSGGSTMPSHGGDAGEHGNHGVHAGAHQDSTEPATTQADAVVTYTCPMHPEVVSNQPGVCPKCRMKLVRKEAAR